jgi:hypothetical protein
MWWALALLLGADTAWQVAWEGDGLTLERRAGPGGSGYDELKVTARTPVGVDRLCDGVWAWSTASTDHDHLKARALLEDRGELKVLHDELELPLVKPRALTFTVRRVRRPEGSCRIEFFSSNERAPPLKPGQLQMPQLKGYWQFDRAGRGAALTYQIFSDPGGSLPAPLVNGSQRDAAVATVKKGIRLSERTHAPPEARRYNARPEREVTCTHSRTTAEPSHAPPSS